MGAFSYFQHSPRPVAGVIAGGVVAGAVFGTVMAFALPRTLGVGRLFELPRADGIAVGRAVGRGEPVSDPRLAPSVLAHAQAVMDSARRQQTQPWRWLLFALAALGLVQAVGRTITGPVWLAVFSWATAAMFLTLGLAWPRILDRRHAKAQAAAEFAADQIGRLGNRPTLAVLPACF
jgi:hypothetical protein